MVVDAAAAYDLWAPVYDETQNPLLALESRMLRDRLGPLAGLRVVDVGAGTGRWMRWMGAQGATTFGVDLSLAMLRRAGLKGRVAAGDVQTLPVASDAADVALCSFVVGYLPSLGQTMREMARVARRVIVSDLHSAAAEAGWSRSFRVADRVYEIPHYSHSRAALHEAAGSAGLLCEWEEEARFGEPERHIFAVAGKSSRFDEVARIAAVAASCWRRA